MPFPDQQAQHDPEDAAHLADDHRFGQELTADQLWRRAQAFGSDFPRALRHRYEHDVHGPDGRAGAVMKPMIVVATVTELIW